MFSFRAIELLHWDLWHHIRVPLDEQIVMIAGPNGSGKTTFLDALRLLLGARSLSTARSLGSYLRGEASVAVVKGVVTNTLRRGVRRRPFGHLGIFDDEVTLACIVERKSSGWQRRYVIRGGDVPLAQLREAGDRLRPEEYVRALERAQLPRTLLKILALEQGETNKLARRSPRQLLEYVLEMQGDKEVIANYEAGLQAYVLSGRELAEQRERVATQRGHVETLRIKVESWRRYEQMRAEVRELETVRIPQARLRALQEDLEKVDADISAIRERVAKREREVAGAAEGAREALERIEALKAREREHRQTQRELLAQKETVDAEYRTAQLELKRIEEALARVEAQAGDPADAGELEKRREGLFAEQGRLAAAVDQARQELVELRKELERLEQSDRPEPPVWVRRMGDALRRAGIEGFLVCEVIDIVDPKWQVAVESVLGRDRFTWVVDARDSLRARKLAQQLRYPCYVTEYDTEPLGAPRRRSALSQVELADRRVPRWILRQLDRVTLVETVEEGMRLGRRAVSITPDGYRQDERGGVHIGVRDLYCGQGARRERLADIERRIGQVHATLRRDERDLARVRARVSEVDDALRALRDRERVEKQRERIPALRERVEELAARRRALTDQITALMAAVDEVNETLRELERRVGLTEYRRRVLEEERGRARAELKQLEARKRRLQTEAAAVAEGLPPQARAPEALADVEEPGQLAERLRVLRQSVETYPGCKDPAVAELYERARAELEEQERVLAERLREHRLGELELHKARRSYIRVVEQTIARYRRNIIALAHRAGIEVDIHVPRLREDDDALREAGIEIRIGFDGKRPVPIHSPKLSGGQSVIASLMLLMALTMQDEEDIGGFFILDEPFAHLSVERIDDITRFLHMTRAQFILTTPTTHNLVVFNPAHLTLSLRKKPPQARYAPVPTFIRR